MNFQPHPVVLNAIAKGFLVHLLAVGSTTRFDQSPPCLSRADRFNGVVPAFNNQPPQTTRDDASASPSPVPTLCHTNWPTPQLCFEAVPTFLAKSRWTIARTGPPTTPSSRTSFLGSRTICNPSHVETSAVQNAFVPRALCLRLPLFPSLGKEPHCCAISQSRSIGWPPTPSITYNTPILSPCRHNIAQ